MAIVILFRTNRYHLNGYHLILIIILSVFNVEISIMFGEYVNNILNGKCEFELHMRSNIFVPKVFERKVNVELEFSTP